MKNTIHYLFLFIFLALFSHALRGQNSFIAPDGEFVWISPQKTLPVLIDTNEYKGVMRAVNHLQSDAEKVTGNKPSIISEPDASELLIIGSAENSQWIKQLISQNKIEGKELVGKNEKYLLTTVENPLPGVNKAVVIAGSDMRGTIYGIYELSRQMGVSPWYYWADVPVEHQPVIAFKEGIYTEGEPAVKYRGIFLNDEWPSLGKWAQQTYGGFNSQFYEQVFELILRLKGNFLWPAMWASAFYDDDPMNGPLADEMGVVMSTSHHEPMALAQQDWKRYGSGDWNYQTNKKGLQEFWKTGMERAKDWESVITIGMRGDGDEPMSEESNITLLQNIVKDQRKIIEQVTGKKAKETPQVWALYKEVQDYYDKGMRVPDDVILLLCDDNWGNVRKLPALDAKPRKGGYGMYYHFDYVGAPRNSKWINISQVQRVWEQMNLTYEHGVKELWVVNVGDLKPMEYPITFFMDMAWNPEQFNAGNLFQHTVDFSKEQFGMTYAPQIARLIDMYSKYNRRITPELLNEGTYSLSNYNEWNTVREEYEALLLEALKIYYLLPQDKRDAYDQLVLYPIQASSNLYDMYYAVAMNKALAAQNNPEANVWADKVKQHFDRDSVLTHQYNKVMSNGKWNHMMDQTHIGYTSWNHPEYNIMPVVQYVDAAPVSQPYLFAEKNGVVSMEAEHYTRASAGNGIEWVIIPNMGRTLSAITTMPATAKPTANTYVEYDFITESKGKANVLIRFSPTLNFNENKGLSYAISIDGNPEKIINLNGHYRGELGKWQADHVIDSETMYHLEGAGKHTLRIRPLDPALVIQKIMIDFGGMKPSYLGAPETIITEE